MYLERYIFRELFEADENMLSLCVEIFEPWLLNELGIVKYKLFDVLVVVRVLKVSKKWIVECELDENCRTVF